MSEKLSISALAERFSIPRDVVKKRLRAAGIEAAEHRPNKILFEVTERLQDVLGTDSELEALKVRKLAAEAELKETQVAEKRGELIPASEVKTAVIAIFSNLFREFQRLNKRIGHRLVKAKTASEITEILQNEQTRIFEKLRTNYTEFLALAEIETKP